MPSLIIRDADTAIVDRLVDLEAASFDSDGLSRRSFRRLVGVASASSRVARVGGTLAGYAILLFRQGTDVARLYSIAVDSRHRGAGLAEALMRDAERIARKRARSVLRLEVREDNHAAIRLYERLGYRQIGRYRHYYADDADALRYEKRFGKRPQERAAEPDEDPSPRDSGARPSYIGFVLTPNLAPSAAAAGANAAIVSPRHS